MSSKIRSRRGQALRRLRAFANREIRSLFAERWFRYGVWLRLVLIVLLVPDVQARWFVPFLAGVPTSPDPFTAWVTAGGDSLAWPYGPMMTIAHFPTMIAGLVGAPMWLCSAIFGATVAVYDLAIVLALRLLASVESGALVARLWWLSPAGLVINYWHGQTDVIPLALLMMALAMFQMRRFRAAGVLVGLSISAKLTMAVAPPFFLIWLGLSRRYHNRLAEVFIPMLGIPALCYGLLLLSPGAREMVLGNPVAAQAIGASIDIRGTEVLVLPALMLALLYVAARARRLGFSLMVGILGNALFALAAVIVHAPGWWLWSLPFLALYAAKSGRREVTAGVWTFSALLALQTCISATGAQTLLWPLPAAAVPPAVKSGVMTLMFAVGLVLAISMFRHTLADNDPYGLASRPVVTGVAGLSGSGKDTLVNALARVLGEREVVAVSCDDYHRWERGSPMWRVWTHSNPEANHMRALADDVRALTAGRSIKCRYYDHAIGRFEPRRSKGYNDIVLVSGLHALYGTAMRDLLDVKVYLDMDESLRRHLKVARDTAERRQGAEDVLRSIERRLPDDRKYIYPQAEFADLVLRLEALHPDALHHGAAPASFRLEARMKNGAGIDQLRRLFETFCWCETQVERTEGSGETRFVFEGDDLTGADVEEIARHVIPHVDDLLAVHPKFEGGVTGVMVLLVLLQIAVVRCADAVRWGSAA